MTGKVVARSICAGVFALALVAVAAPARAQTALGAVHGHVMDEAGKPVADADISYDCVGDMKLHFTGKTDSKGEYNRGGLQLGACIWSITVTKGNLKGGAMNLDVPKGNAVQVPNITLRGAAGATAAAAPGASASDANKVFADAKALEAQNNFDGAVTALQGLTTKDPKCAQCFVRLGDALFQKAGASTDADKQAALDNSEKAYQAAIAVNDKSKDAGEAYMGLVSVYNTEKRFDDAGKANDKATEVAAATTPAGGTAAAGGGNDATAAYNAGVILWNQSKMPEAEAKFSEAIKLKPSMADAHYYLGMCLINEGKMDDAKKALNDYLKLAPSGENAATAKSILDSLPK